MVAAICHFRYMLEGRRFVIFTDHKPLVGALHRRSDPISARQQRHLSFIAEFAPSIRHITGESNIVADTLFCPSGECSAPPLPTLNSPGTAEQGATEVKVPSGSSVPPAIAGLSSSPPPVDLAAAQAACPDCQRASSSPALRVSEVTLHGSPLLVDTSSGVFRPLVPAAFCQPIFDAIHNLAHPGIRATKRLISSRFVLLCLASQVAAWCKDCQQCQWAKVSSQPAALPSHIANPTQRFSHIHIDLVGPLQTVSPTCSQWWTGLRAGQRRFRSGRLRRQAVQTP